MRKVLVLGMMVALMAGMSLIAMGFQIGLVTGTVSQNEEEFRGGEYAVAKYGDMIIHVTYPDNFMVEQETTMAQIIQFAYNPNVKAIVVNQAVPGTVPALRRVQEMRPDIFTIAVSPQEDPWIVMDTVSIALNTADLARGRTIPQVAKAMGAETFLHYTFPRHMSIEILARRRDIMRDTCAEIGLKFVELAAPDPMGPDGIPGTQQFMMEDIPRQIAIYGPNTAVFGTNCAMQEQIITQVIATGALYPEQCCPSPGHAYPGALGLEVTEHMRVEAQKGNLAPLVAAIDARVRELGAAGRLGTWPVAMPYEFSKGAVEVAIALIEGKITPDDMAGVRAVMEESAGGYELAFSRFDESGEYYFIEVGSIIFGLD
jgi:hypothetical protein